MVEIRLKAEPLMFAERVGVGVRTRWDRSCQSKWKDRVSITEMGKTVGEQGGVWGNESPTWTG